MHAPGHVRAVAEQTVDGQAAGPHQIGAGLVVVRLLQCDRAVVHQRLEHRLAHPRLEVRTLDGGEVVLQGVAHDVRSARTGLPGRYGEGVLRIQNRHHGLDALGSGAPLLVLLEVGDDCELVHLGAGGGERQHGVDRQRPLNLLAVDHQIPGVAVVACACRHDLGAVDAGAAAHGQHHLDAVCVAELHAPAHGFDAGIGLHAGELGDLHTVFGEHFHHIVVQAAALDAAAAVDQQHFASAVLQLGEVGQLIGAEVDGGGNAVGKVVHFILLDRMF